MTHANDSMISGLARVKWWRYRYLLVALLIINAFAIHSFFFDRSIQSLNPFHSTPVSTGYESFPPLAEGEKSAQSTGTPKHAGGAHVAEPGKPVDKQDEEVDKQKAEAEKQKVEAEKKKAEADKQKAEADKQKAGADKQKEKPQVEKKPGDDEKPADKADAPKGEEDKPKPAEPAKEDKDKPTQTDAEKLKDPPYVKPAMVIPSYPPVKFTPPPTSKAGFGLQNYNDFYGKFEEWPLKRVCKETTYQPGLTYVCDNNTGGIGNIRNFILTCIRYAIEAGATGLIMPQIQRRAKTDLVNLFTNSFQPFSYFFDEEHFRTVMAKSCPQMIVYNSLHDIPHNETLYQAKEFAPKGLHNGDGCDGRGLNRHIDRFREQHDIWIKKYHRAPNATHPVSVRFTWAVFFEWPIYRDGPEFAMTFGDILRIRPDIAELAATTIDQLVMLAKGTTRKPNRKKLDVPYLGVHLRTEGDALDFWPNFENQTMGYLKQAGTRGLKHAYLASGDVAEGHKFAELADKHLGMKVVSKTDLLHGEARGRLNALSWDQQALVDFLVLMKSSHFTGCSFSSFAMNLAVKRHSMIDGINTRQWKSPGDEYSTLVGRFDSWFGDWMFMLECMWP